MPEILEVETYRRQAEAVVDRTIVDVQAPDAWYVKRSDPQKVVVALAGQRVTAVRRTGKLIVVELENGGRLGLRFGMTGRLIVDGSASIDRLEYSSSRNDPGWDRFVLLFGDGGELRMRDPRRLGGVELEPDEGRLGADAFAVTPENVATALGSSTAPLKARLLDQARIAGIGNLLADEILWRSALDPARPAGSLARDELIALHDAIRDTLSDLMARGGSHTGDLRAAFLDDGRCPWDEAPLERRQVGGRTTLSCPKHQV